MVSDVMTESDSCFVTGFMIASDIVTESDNTFVTDFVIASVMVTVSECSLNSTIAGSS